MCLEYSNWWCHRYRYDIAWYFLRYYNQQWPAMIHPHHALSMRTYVYIYISVLTAQCQMKTSFSEIPTNSKNSLLPLNKPAASSHKAQIWATECHYVIWSYFYMHGKTEPLQSTSNRNPFFHCRLSSFSAFTYLRILTLATNIVDVRNSWTQQSTHRLIDCGIFWRNCWV